MNKKRGIDWSNPDEVREYNRRWREENRDRLRAYARENSDRTRKQATSYRQRNRDKIREQQRASYQRNREGRLERARARRDPEKHAFIERLRKHGMRPEQAFALLAEQQSQCYLCGKPLELDKSAIDHDHRCCPAGTSCPICRRGFACNNCNSLIGMAGDDPERLRMIADNLEVAIAIVTIRLRGKPEQLSLIEEAS